MTTRSPHPNETVLFYAAKPRDLRLACGFLNEAGIEVHGHSSLESLMRELAAGLAGAIVLTEAGVSDGAFDTLKRLLLAQPAWSDIPVILFVPSRRSALTQRLLEIGGNVTTFEWPVMSATLVTALRSALRSRRKQYEMRDLLEGLQRATTRLREQDRRKDEFLAMLGHELRNPLAAIHNSLYLLQRGRSAETVDHAHTVIERQSRHLARLVDDLLDVSRVTLGRIQLVREPVDVQEVAARCVASFEPDARGERRGLRLEASGGPLVVDGDATRLEQVLSNLVINALKYTPAGGEIVVRTEREGGHAVVRVRDTGIGIDPDVLPQMFELFTQGTQPLDRQRGGLGLGLSLVKSLLERHDGTIEASSDGPGHGCEFVVRLPLTASAERPVPPGPGGDSLRDLAHRVLLIEDNDDARETLRMMLEMWGCHVSTARDGRDGLQKLLALRPDFAIVDIGLPGLDGYEVARRARAADLDGSLLLIAMTGYGQPEDNRRALEAGFDVHLTKPVRSSDLAPWLARTGPSRNGHGCPNPSGAGGPSSAAAEGVAQDPQGSSAVGP